MKSEKAIELDQQKSENLSPTSQSSDICCKATNMEKKNTKPLHTITHISDYHTEDAKNEWDKRNEKNIPVPAGGLCMYHCASTAGDPEWMRDRHPSDTSYDRHRERADATIARALRQKFIDFLYYSR